METSLQKIDTLRQDIRKAEKLRRELELRTEDALNEAAKEKKIREKVEASSKQMEKEVGMLKNATAVPGGAAALAGGMPDDGSEVSLLRQEIERLEISSQEALLNQQSKHNAELATIREQIDESERRARAYEMDVQTLREKLDKARLDSLQVHNGKTYPWNLFFKKASFLSPGIRGDDERDAKRVREGEAHDTGGEQEAPGGA